MRLSTITRPLTLLLALLLIAACGPGSPTGAGEATPQGEAATAEGEAATAEGEATPQGGAATAEGDDQARQVAILGALTGPDEAAFNEVIAVFEQQHPDVDVTYTGAPDFDSQLEARVEAGEAPDIAAYSQPGGAARQAAAGNLVPLWDEAVAALDANYAPIWRELGSFESTPYGVFHRVSAKGFIWYNRPAWEAAGWAIPRTWDELMALQEEMKASGTAPWCDGIGAGPATGWKGTDWVENIMLRTQPVEAYDRWVAGDLAFTSPEVTGAFELLGAIWQDPEAVYGGPQTIALAPADQAAQFLFDEPPACWMHMQGSFATSFFPEEVQSDLDEQVGVFLMPPIDPALEPTLEVGGDLFVAFEDRPEVRAFMEFLTTVEAITPWAEQGGALFPHRGQDFGVYPTELEGAMARTIAEAGRARFDGSDNMADAVNQAFWKGITDWVSGNRDLSQALEEIDAAGMTANSP